METTFGARLKQLRLAKRLSQRELATMADIDVTYLSKIENGRMDLRQRILSGALQRI